MRNSATWFTAALVLFLSACRADAPADFEGTASAAQLPECDADNGGLELPDGFCAVVVADSLGNARHLTVAENGDIYVALRREGGGIMGLRDADGDGKAEQIERISDISGTGIGLHGGYLYFAPDTAVLRYPLQEGTLKPTGPYEFVVRSLPIGAGHTSKPFTFDEDGWMYITIGAPSNACQEQDRTPGSAAPDPCTMLERFGGIWRVRADETNQTFDGSAEQYATGIRNMMALDWNENSGHLYGLQHGRDMLHDLFPDQYTQEQSAELPAEEFFMIDQGDNFGWPFCYYDGQKGKKVLGPEYGGDGETTGRCDAFEKPIASFPGHYAPNDLVFYDGSAFPAKYRNGAFVAIHGSWNRAPLPQQGFMVAFIPFNGANPSGNSEVFADGFKGADVIENPSNARYRPVGLAVGPDGSLYIADSQKGRIWRVMYKG